MRESRSWKKKMYSASPQWLTWGEIQNGCLASRRFPRRMLPSTALSARARRHLASRCHPPPPTPRTALAEYIHTLSSRRATVLYSVNDETILPAVAPPWSERRFRLCSSCDILFLSPVWPTVACLSFFHPPFITHARTQIPLSLSLSSLLSLYHLQNTSSAYACSFVYVASRNFRPMHGHASADLRDHR